MLRKKQVNEYVVKRIQFCCFLSRWLEAQNFFGFVILRASIVLLDFVQDSLLSTSNFLLMCTVIKPKESLLPQQRPKPYFSYPCQVCVSFSSATAGPDGILGDVPGIFALWNFVTAFFLDPNNS